VKTTDQTYVFRHARTRAVLLSAAAALGTLAAASPALAADGSGGSGSPTGTGGSGLTPTTTGLPGSGSNTSSSTSTTPAPSANPLVQPSNGDATVSATGAGITLSTVASALLRNQLTFPGTAPVSDAGRTIVIDRLGHETNWSWQPTVSATVSPQGTFSVTWSTDHIGAFQIRAVLGSAGTQGADASSIATSAPIVQITVYRPSVASWYGPGMFGSRTACGVKLTRSTIGLANKTLKCGESVALYYQGRTLTVPVIDRGPYAHHADWDLTEATAQALGMQGAGVVTIGAVSLPAAPASA
jgi:rare lipoprotein A